MMQRKALLKRKSPLQVGKIQIASLKVTRVFLNLIKAANTN